MLLQNPPIQDPSIFKVNMLADETPLTLNISTPSLINQSPITNTQTTPVKDNLKERFMKASAINQPAINLSTGTPNNGEINFLQSTGPANVLKEPTKSPIISQQEKDERQALSISISKEINDMLNDFRVKYPHFDGARLPINKYRTKSAAKPILPETLLEYKKEIGITLSKLEAEAEAQANGVKRQVTTQVETQVSKNIEQIQKGSDADELARVNNSLTMPPTGDNGTVIQSGMPANYAQERDYFLCKSIYNCQYGLTNYGVSTYMSDAPEVQAEIMQDFADIEDDIVEGTMQVINLYPNDPIVQMLRGPFGILAVSYGGFAARSIARYTQAKKTRVQIPQVGKK